MSFKPVYNRFPTTRVKLQEKERQASFVGVDWLVRKVSYVDVRVYWCSQVLLVRVGIVITWLKAFGTIF